jgi:hypothetical protein
VTQNHTSKNEKITARRAKRYMDELPSPPNVTEKKDKKTQ